MDRRILGLVLSFILMFSFFIGCSSASKKSDSAVSMDNSEFANSGKESGFRGESAPSSPEVGVKFNETAYKTKGEDIKKIIKNGNMSVEVKNVDASYIKIMEIVRNIGGEEFNKNYNISGDYKRMELVLKIPPENLNLFQDKITEYVGAGKVRNISIRSTDITSEYYDFTARLESYQASRDQMLELLKKAANIDDTLRIQSEITRLQADIDSMQGQIRMWDKLISMATITLNIDQEDSPFKTKTQVSWRFNSFSEIWITMKNGFVNVVNTIYSLIIWLIIAIVSASPIILILGIVLYVLFYIKKKRKNNIE